ncbi:MAG TPA: hypothetical protein HPP83_08030 [Candidatus Hydrogenedentes bacterium]|nr:hypothetical protein [Candidatus Hydrogenedentota bacterium]
MLCGLHVAGLSGRPRETWEPVAELIDDLSCAVVVEAPTKPIGLAFDFKPDWPDRLSFFLSGTPSARTFLTWHDAQTFHLRQRDPLAPSQGASAVPYPDETTFNENHFVPSNDPYDHPRNADQNAETIACNPYG